MLCQFVPLVKGDGGVKDTADRRCRYHVLPSANSSVSVAEYVVHLMPQFSIFVIKL